MTLKNIVWMGTVFVVLSFCGSSAFAFDEQAVTSVKEQPNPYYTAQGGRIGTLIVKPWAEFAHEYDDNIYSQSQDQKNDRVNIAKAGASVETDWQMHQIKLGADGEFGRFEEYNSENYDDHSYFISGRFDIDYETYAALDVRSQYRHEDRSSLDDVGGEEPIEYRVDTATARLTRALGIVKFYLTGIYREFTYEDSIKSGAVIDNSTRDRTHEIIRGRIAYSLSDDYAVFIQAQHERREYDVSGTAYRNSDGEEYRAGISVNMSGKLQGDLYVGRIKQSYDSGFDDITENVYGGHLLWNMNGITSLRGVWENQVAETTLSGSSGVLRTRGRVEIEHAFRDYFMFDGYTGFQDDHYEGSSTASRDNITYMSGAGLDYKFTEKMGVRLDYNYRKRDFDGGSGSDYDNHKLRFSVKYEY